MAQINNRILNDRITTYCKLITSILTQYTNVQKKEVHQKCGYRRPHSDYPVTSVQSLKLRLRIANLYRTH